MLNPRCFTSHRIFFFFFIIISLEGLSKEQKKRERMQRRYLHQEQNETIGENLPYPACT